MQRVFATGQSGLENNSRHEFVYVLGGTEGEECMWVSRSCFPVGLPSVAGNIQRSDSRCTWTWSNLFIRRTKNCVFLSSTTGLRHDYAMLALGSAPMESIATVGVSYYTEQFDSLIVIVHVLWANWAVHLLTLDQPWYHYRFFVDRCHVLTSNGCRWFLQWRNPLLIHCNITNSSNSLVVFWIIGNVTITNHSRLGTHIGIERFLLNGKVLPSARTDYRSCHDGHI